MAILSLPNELLLSIISIVHPVTLPNLSITCRRMRILAKQKLNEYSCHKTTSLSSVPRLDSNHPVELISRLLQEPGLAFYMTDILFESNSKSLEYIPTHPWQDRARLILQDLTKSGQLSKLIEKLGTLNSDERIAVYNGNAIFSILLPMLFNLRKLRLMGSHWRARSMFPRLVDRAISDPTVLSNLQIVECVDTSSPSTYTWDAMYPFVSLPSVATFRAFLDGRSCSFEWPEQTQGPYSSITTVELSHTSLSTRMVTTMLRRMNRLKIFRYHYSQGVTRVCQSSFSAGPDAILEILGKTVPSTVEVLSLTGFTRFPPEGYVPSLRKLRVCTTNLLRTALISSRSSKNSKLTATSSRQNFLICVPKFYFVRRVRGSLQSLSTLCQNRSSSFL